MSADEMFEELGYENYEDLYSYNYYSRELDLLIILSTNSKEVHIRKDEDMLASISMQELKAINKKCEELGWI